MLSEKGWCWVDDVKRFYDAPESKRKLLGEKNTVMNSYDSDIEKYSQCHSEDDFRKWVESETLDLETEVKSQYGIIDKYNSCNNQIATISTRLKYLENEKAAVAKNSVKL